MKLTIDMEILSKSWQACMFYENKCAINYLSVFHNLLFEVNQVGKYYLFMRTDSPKYTWAETCQERIVANGQWLCGQ
jgi:hypothetical protein